MRNASTRSRRADSDDGVARDGCRTVLIVAATIIGSAGFSLSSGAADWQLQLEDQMLLEHDCTVDYYVTIQDDRPRRDGALRVRVHCDDLRVFEATRPSDSRTFEVKVCGTHEERGC